MTTPRILIVDSRTRPPPSATHIPPMDELQRFLTDDEKRELAQVMAQDHRIFFPTPGPQYEAFSTKADIIGYGGAAGGGKSYLVCGLALTEHRRSVVFRQHKNQTRKFVQDFGKILGNSNGYSSQNSEWHYGGKLIEFGGLEDPTDHEKWQGRDHDLKAYDEATQMREYDVRYTMGWNRSDDPSQRCRTLLTFNPPTTPEGRWVIRFFAPWLDKSHPRPAADGEIRWFTTVGDDPDYEVPDDRPFVLDTSSGRPVIAYDFDPAEHEPEEIIRPKSRTFITARVTDNPYYMATGYMQQLQLLPEPLRSQMLRGDFMAGVEDDSKQVIPTSWVEMAFDRYDALTAKADWKLPPQSALGVDAARGGNMGGTTGATGKDKMTIAPRHDLANTAGEIVMRVFPPVVAHKGIDVNTGNLAAAQIIALRRDGAPVQLDVASIGTSVFDALNEHSIHTVPLNNAAASQGKDKSNLLAFSNRRAEFYWRMREALDPEAKPLAAIARDPEVLADLTSARSTLKSTGIVIEPKDDIKKRIGRSPDKGEAVIYANVSTPKRNLVMQGYSGLPSAIAGRATGAASNYDVERLRELG